MRITLTTALLSQLALVVLAAPTNRKLSILKTETQLQASLASCGSTYACPASPDGSSGVGFKAIFSLTNNGNEVYKILKTPTSIFSTTFKTEKFSLVKKDAGPGYEPEFMGMQLKWDAEGLFEDEDLFILHPGQKVSTEHDLTDTYDFARSGPGVYTLSPSPLVQLVDSTGEIKLAQLELVPKVDITINRQMWQTMANAVARVKQAAIQASGNYSTAAARITNCPGHEDTIIAAAAAANLMLKEVQNHVNITSAVNLWDLAPTKRWFGVFDQGRFRQVKSSLDSIKSPFQDAYKYDCACKIEGGEKLYAYVIRGLDSELINLCPPYFTALTTGYSSQAGILIHEASHLMARTKDVKYGLKNCTELALEDPGAAVTNADSYELLAETAWPVALEPNSPSKQVVEYLSEFISTLMTVVPYW